MVVVRGVWALDTELPQRRVEVHALSEQLSVTVSLVRSLYNLLVLKNEIDF